VGPAAARSTIDSDLERTLTRKIASPVIPMSFIPRSL
jgi:hypothetical protein